MFARHFIKRVIVFTLIILLGLFLLSFFGKGYEEGNLLRTNTTSDVSNVPQGV